MFYLTPVPSKPQWHPDVLGNAISSALLQEWGRVQRNPLSNHGDQGASVPQNPPAVARAQGGGGAVDLSPAGRVGGEQGEAVGGRVAGDDRLVKA